MSRSIDVVLLDANIRITVLSAPVGVTNILVILAGGLEPTERSSQLNALHQIQLNILERLRYPNVIREEIERLLESITALVEAAALTSSTVLTDELVSRGELVFILLFIEILRERGIQAQWSDTRKVLYTDDHFGHTEPDIAAVAEPTQQQLAPRLVEGPVVAQGFISSEAKGRTITLGHDGSDHIAALLGGALNATRVSTWAGVPGVYTADPRVAPAAKRIDVIALEEAVEMVTFGAKVLYSAILLPTVRSDIPVFAGSGKESKAGGALVCRTAENPPLFCALTLRCRQVLLTPRSLNMLHSHGSLAEVFGILARHSISTSLITTSEVSAASAMDTTGSISAGDTLLTRVLLTEFSSLYRVKVEEDLALAALIGSESLKVCGVDREVLGVLEPSNICIICYDASSYNFCFLVPSADMEKVVQKLRHDLFE